MSWSLLSSYQKYVMFCTSLCHLLIGWIDIAMSFLYKATLDDWQGRPFETSSNDPLHWLTAVFHQQSIYNGHFLAFLFHLEGRNRSRKSSHNKQHWVCLAALLLSLLLHFWQSSLSSICCGIKSHLSLSQYPQVSPNLRGLKILKITT